MTPTPQQLLAILEQFPRLGWVQTPTPVQAMPQLAARLGLPWLGAKRDDLCTPLFGGAKVRKLDFLLAAEPWASAQAWISVGAIGSGHLVACTAAAQALSRQMHAEVFWEPLSEGVDVNLAYVAGHAAHLHYHRSRLSLALSHPGLLLGAAMPGRAVIPPGGTVPVAMIGLVRAGLELAEQVRDGQLPEPQRIYVSLGSGGTAVGLAMGLAVGGLKSTVYAVAAVERLLATRLRIDHLLQGLRREFTHMGLDDWAEVEPNPLVIDYGHVGRGYGHSSSPSLRAVDALHSEGIDLEPIYTGKAMAGLIADAERAKAGGHKLGNVLFWHTVRRAQPLPAPDDWQGRLPPLLRNHLKLRAPTRLLSRRRWIAVTGLTAVTASAALVWQGGPQLSDWQGTILSAKEAAVLAAAVEALLHPAPEPGTWQAAALGVDRWLAQIATDKQREIKALLHLVDLAPWADGTAKRLAELPIPDRLLHLQRLQRRSALTAQAVQGLCDLSHLGYYQLPCTWTGLQYDGPLVPAKPRPWRRAYLDLLAPPGQMPAALRRQS